MSTDGRPMQDPGSANNGSSPDKNKEKKSVSNRIIYNKRRLEIRERSSAENPIVGGKRKEQLAKEEGTTTLQITARTLQPAERGSRTSVPHSFGWHSAKRTAKCKNAPQLQPPPAIPLQLLLLASGLQIPNQRNTPRNVQSTAESVQPVSAANFTRAVSGYGARRYTPCTFVTGPLLQLNTAHLGAGFISSGEDPRTVGFLRVHSESADGTETGVHLNQSHLAAGFISAGSDSISSPHQRWRNEKLLERPDNLAQKFKHMADIHEEWTRGKEEMLQSEDFRQCRLNDVKGFKKKHEAFESDLATQQDSVKQIAAIAQELNALGYHEAASVNARCQLICDQWDRLDILTQKRRSAREEAERVLEIDHLYLEFAKRVARFNSVMDGARDYLVDMFIVHTMEEIQGLMDVHEQFKQTLGEADKEYKAIVELVHEVQVVASQFKVPGGVENPYTTLTSQVITGKWSEVKQLAPKRGQVLQAELMRQQSNERLRRKFAEKADVVGPWIEREMDALAAFEMGIQGSLEEQLKRLHEYEQAVAQYRPHLAELERSHQKVQEAMILENRYTHYTIETLRVDWDQLLTSIHSSVSNVTLGHMNEFRMSFEHREKNRTARLTSEEFMSCQVKLDYRSIMNIVDPNNTVCDHDDASLDFMTRESTNRETDEEIIKCIRTMTGDKPYITADELRRQLPPEVAEYCMQRMPAYKGHGAVPGALDYKSFSTALYGTSSL